jgi:hypothetical protein
MLVHMGAGDPDSMLDTILRTVDDYAEVARHLGAPQPGLCAVSVFALIRGVTHGDVFDAMPQRQFGEASYGEVRAVFPVLPTMILDPAMPQPVRDLQSVHFDVVLPPPPALIGRRAPVADMTAADRADLRAALRPDLMTLIDLFAPRSRKYHG